MIHLQVEPLILLMTFDLVLSCQMPPCAPSTEDLQALVLIHTLYDRYANVPTDLLGMDRSPAPYALSGGQIRATSRTLLFPFRAVDQTDLRESNHRTWGELMAKDETPAIITAVFVTDRPLGLHSCDWPLDKGCGY